MAFLPRWDSRDKRGQDFSNHLLDQTVIQDNELNGHATVWNQTADRLVRDNPQRYEYVDTPDISVRPSSTRPNSDSQAAAWR